MEVVIRSSDTRNIVLRWYYFIFYPERAYTIIKNEPLAHSIFISFFSNFFGLLYIFFLSAIFEIILRMSDIVNLKNSVAIAFEIVLWASFLVSLIILGLDFLLALFTYSFAYKFKSASYESVLKSFLYSSMIPVLIFIGYRILQLLVPLGLMYLGRMNQNSFAILRVSHAIYSWGSIFDYIVLALVIVNFFYFLIKSMAYFLNLREKDVLIATLIPSSTILFLMLMLYDHIGTAFLGLLRL